MPSAWSRHNSGSKVKLGLSFFQMGLCITVLPFLFALVSILFIYLSFQDAQTYARQAEKLLAQSQLAEGAFASLVSHGYVKLGPVFSGRQDSSQSVLSEPGFFHMEQEAQSVEVADLVEGSKALEARVDREVSSLSSMSFHSNQARLLSYAGLTLKTLEQGLRLDNFLVESEGKSREIWQKWERKRTWTMLISLISIFCSLLMSFFVVRYFNKRIVSRLLHLRWMVEHLGRGAASASEQVPSQAKFVDDFSVIESAFKKLDGDIERTRKQSEAIVSVLARELYDTASSLPNNLVIKIKEFADELALLSGSIAPSRLAEPEVKSFYVGEVVLKVFAQVKALAAKKDIRLVYKEMEPDLQLESDAGMFEKVLANLIGNALKFAPHGTTVGVKALFLDGYRTHPLVEVSDQGSGLSKELEEWLLSSALEFSANGLPAAQRDGQGFGLGLSFCKKMMERCGGRLKYRKNAEGSFFVLDFSAQKKTSRPDKDGQRENGKAKPPLAQRSLFLKKMALLLCLPLLFQTVALAFLSFNLESCNHMLAQVRARQELSTSACRLWLNLFSGGYWTAMSLALQRPLYRQNAGDCLTRVRGILPHVEQYKNDQIMSARIMRELLPTVKEELSRVEATFESSAASGDVVAQEMIGGLAFSIKRGQDFSSRMVAVLDAQFKQIDKLLQEQARKFTALQVQFLLFTIFSFAFALILPVSYSLALVRRLEGLAAMAGSPESIKCVSRGGAPDEIDELAGRLADMVAQLQENEAVRESIVKSIAHDIRSPIQNLLLLLPEDDTKNGAYLRFQRALSLAEDLLLWQKLLADRKVGAAGVEPRKTISLGEIFSDLVADLAREAQDKDIFIELSGTFPQVSAAQRALSLLLTGFLRFALYLSRPGGEIKLSVRQAEDAMCTVCAQLDAYLKDEIPKDFSQYSEANSDIDGFALSLKMQVLQELALVNNSSMQMSFNRELGQSLLELDIQS